MMDATPCARQYIAGPDTAAISNSSTAADIADLVADRPVCMPSFPDAIELKSYYRFYDADDLFSQFAPDTAKLGSCTVKYL
jgi:hypothetical protein